MVEGSSVLLLSTDALAAALLGALVESVGYVPRFARDHEPPREALRRTRAAVVLVECDHPDAWGPALIGPAKMVGARVVLFGPPARQAEVRRCAELWNVDVLAIPPTAETLRRALAADPPR